jgi:hypothetical protein
MLNFMQNLQTEEHDFQEAFVNAKQVQPAPGNIPTSKDICGIEIRLSNVIIRYNKTPKVFPFPGFAKVYFLNLVLSDVNTDSISIDLKGFEKVDDGDALNIDRTLFIWKKKEDLSVPPSQIQVFTSLIKSKQPLRDVARVMTDVKNDSNFKDAVSSLNTLLKTTSGVSNISGLVFQVAGIIGSFLGKVDDKPLLTWIQSFTDIHGDFDPLGETKKNASNKFASMELSITIRDNAR